MKPGYGPAGPFDTTFESTLAHVESVLDTSPVVLFSAVVEGDGMRPFWVSSNVHAVIGYTTGEALAPGWWWNNLHPHDRAAASRSADELVRRGHYSHEYRFRHANGAYIWMLDQMKLIRRDGDQRVVGSWTNVSTNRQEREQLHAAERHYRRLVQTSPYGIYVVDREGLFTEVNAAGARILGRPDLLGTSFRSVVAPDHLDSTVASLERIMSGAETNLEFEVGIVRPDGAERLLVVSATAILDDGVISGAHGLARDVTEERRIEGDREAARRHYERLVATSPYAIYALDLDGRFTEVNRSTAELLGVAAADLMGQPFSRVVAPEDREKAARSFSHRLADESGASEIDLRLVRSDGERRLVHIRAARIHEGDRLVGSHGIGQDITEQRAQADRMLIFGAALDQLPEGVRIVDDQGAVVYANASYRRLLGNDTAADPFAATADGDALRADMIKALAEDGTWRGVLTCTNAETGKTAPVELVAASVMLAGRTLTFALVQDLTDEIARETQLRRAERLASVGTLVTGVAHELNNPLTAIAGFAELMLLEPRSDDDREILNLTLREASRAAKIVADLRMFATESKTEPTEYGTVNINEIIDHVLKLQRFTLETDGIGIAEDLGPDVAPVRGSATELEQVVLNLIVNACQALADKNVPERTISVHTRMDEDLVVLRIADSGPGIPQNIVDRIFDPFFTTRSPGDGMGLGLSVVHRIVTDHGGRLEVQSPAGAGAVVIVSLPASRASGDERVASAASRPMNLHVLVVDDEEPIRRALVRYLNRRGHTVDVATDGAAALDLMDGGNFDVILSDLRMPGMGGEQMLDHLREHNPRAAKRVMFMTGHVAHNDPSLTSRYADVEVIEKPFSLSEVGDAVENVAARVRQAENA